MTLGSSTEWTVRPIPGPPSKPKMDFQRRHQQGEYAYPGLPCGSSSRSRMMALGAGVVA